MATFDELREGAEFETPSVAVSGEDAVALVRIGGYTHPLFTDAAFAASTPIGRTPLPGQALLLLMGGAVERSNRFDATVIALVGLDAEFKRPAFAGDEMRVRVAVGGKTLVSGGRRGLMTMTWTALRNDDALCVATARMLFRLRPDEGEAAPVS